MTDLGRLLAAGDALADAVVVEHEAFGITAETLKALEIWRALAREVKEKGDDA